MARHSGASLALQLFGIGCGFLFAVAAARLLGARGYGLVAVALSVANTAAVIALLGANGLAVREVSASAAHSDWIRLRGFVRWSVSTVAVTSGLTGLFVAALAFVSGPYRNVVLVGSVGVPIVAALQLLRGVNQGAQRIVAAQMPMDVLRWIPALAIMAFLITTHFQPSPTQVLGVVLVSYVISLVLAAVALRRYLRGLPSGDAARSSSAAWLRASLPFLTVSLLGIAATEMNTLLLGVLSGPRDAGLYQPIAKIAPLMLLGRDAIQIPLAPRIVALREAKEQQTLVRLIHRSSLAATLVTIVIVSSILIASPWIFAAFGSDFESVRSNLYWIAAAQIVNCAFGASPILLAMAGDMKGRIQAQAVTLVVQAALTLTLVPAFGVTGAVVALSLQMVAWAGVHWLLAKRSTGIDTSVLAAARAWRARAR